MHGLDPALVDELDYGLAIGRIKTDVLTDFILAPHHSIVYEYAADELIERVKTLLRHGRYAPGLPIKIDIPKPSGLTRPGAILTPIDRLTYQIIVDRIGPQAEAQLDRSRVFSYVLLTDDPEFKMFEPKGECWQNMQHALRSLCQNGNFPYVIKTDVSNHFEQIFQHSLINLLRSSGCDSRAVNLLEKLLLDFAGNNSQGILQGMFPSDLLGNFSLSSLDYYLEIQGVPCIRYVDDLYLFYASPLEAKRGLVNVCRILRNEGLNLNESKTTKPCLSIELLAEETEIDRLFEQAKQEILETPILVEEIENKYGYGFESTWLTGEDALSREEIELGAVKELYRMTSEGNEAISQKIEKFCLPYFSIANDDIAVERSLQGIVSNPHLSKVYCGYLKPLARHDNALSSQLEQIIRDHDIPYEWSLIWPIAVLSEVDSVASDTVDQAIRIIEDSRKSDALRGIAVHLVAKHGNSRQRRLLKHRYEQEPSSYVQQAILFATKHFPTNERNSCLGAWGGHSTTNSLIASAIRSGTP